MNINDTHAILYNHTDLANGLQTNLSFSPPE